MGPLPAAENLEYLASLNCSKVVTVMWDPPPALSSITRHHVAIRDDNEAHLLPFFQESSTAIENWLSAGDSVLVHCSSGISRSATVVTAYLISRGNMSLRSAYAVVRDARPCIGPGTTFFADLQQYEKQSTGNDTSMSMDEYYAYTVQSNAGPGVAYGACLEAVRKFGYANDWALMQAISYVTSNS